MRASRLAELFGLVDTPRDAGTLCAARLSPTSRYRVARDLTDNAILLLEMDESLPIPGTRAIRLRHFEYEPRVSATVRDAGAPSAHTSTFLVLRCREGDADLRLHFFELLEGLVEYLGEWPSPEEADKAVRDLVELFRSMSGPTRRTIAGLWAELLTLVDAADPQLAAAAWHSDPAEEHDFVLGNERVEVKSTTRPVREHEVSLGQLIVPPGGVCIVISVMLEPNDAGVSANDLLAKAVSALPVRSEARKRLRAIVATTIGEDWRQAEQVRFDLLGARTSRRAYEAGTIPTVDPRVPPQVSRVRFTVDLSDTVPLSSEVASARGALSAALLGGPVRSA